MRNLKRALSLALASVMLLGMMVVGAGAASYTDVDENDNVEAIEVLNAVKVMIGRQGNFEPDEPVNRHEMAVIMAKLYLGVDIADNYVGTHPYTDVVPWADKYVAACYENGLTSGVTATTYGGGNPLTAVQAAAMMLRALGYKDLSVGAKDWRAPVTAMANQIRLFNGVANNPNETLNRNQVAQLALNTLKSPMVNLKDNTISWSNDEGQIIMTGGSREYIVLSSQEAYARAINDVESKGTSASAIGGYTVELGEHLYNGKLKLNNKDIDVFGRPSRTWEYDGKQIGSYIKEELMVKNDVGKVTGNDLYTLLGKSAIDDYDVTVTIDGVDDDQTNAAAILGGAYFDVTDMNRNNKDTVGDTGTGTLTQVFVDHENNQVYVAVINTYLARAARDYDEKAEEATLTVYGIDEYLNSDVYAKDLDNKADETMKIQDEDFNGFAKDIKKDDAFLVTVADGEIQTIQAAEVLEAVTLTAFKKGDHVVSDGTTYKYTTTATYNKGDLDAYTTTDNTNLKDITYNIYLDAYDNLIGIKEVDAVKNYVFLAGIDLDGSNLYNKNATANALFLDGTSKTITINMNKSVWTAHKPKLANTNVVISGDALLNTWCTYTVNSDGVYTVTEVYATSANPHGDATANANNYPQPDATGTVPNKTKLAQSWQATTNTGKVEVKNLRLSGGGATGSAFANVYGDSTSVYLTAELDELGDREVGTSYGIIKDVDSVSTGIADTTINIWDKDYAITQTDKATVITNIPKYKIAYGVYTLYDSDGIVIAAVVVGENDGAKDLVYVHSDGLDLETYNSTEDEWTWTRKVIFNGEEITLTEKGDSLSDLGAMERYQWYEIKRNSNGELLKATPAWAALSPYRVDTLDGLTPTKTHADAKGIYHDDGYFVNRYDDINQRVETANKDTVLYQTDGGPVNYANDPVCHNHKGLDQDLIVIGNNTLAVQTETGSGIHFRDNVNVVWQYYNQNTKQVEIETGTGLEAVKDMVDFVNKNNDTDRMNGGVKKYYFLSALIEKNFATTIVVYDSYNNYEKGEVVLTGTYLEADATIEAVNKALLENNVIIKGEWRPSDLLKDNSVNANVVKIPSNRTLVIDGNFIAYQNRGADSGSIYIESGVGSKLIVNGDFSMANQNLSCNTEVNPDRYGEGGDMTINLNPEKGRNVELYSKLDVAGDLKVNVISATDKTIRVNSGAYIDVDGDLTANGSGVVFTIYGHLEYDGTDSNTNIIHYDVYSGSTLKAGTLYGTFCVGDTKINTTKEYTGRVEVKNLRTTKATGSHSGATLNKGTLEITGANYTTAFNIGTGAPKIAFGPKASDQGGVFWTNDTPAVPAKVADETYTFTRNATQVVVSNKANTVVDTIPTTTGVVEDVTDKGAKPDEGGTVTPPTGQPIKTLTLTNIPTAEVDSGYKVNVTADNTTVKVTAKPATVTATGTVTLTVETSHKEGFAADLALALPNGWTKSTITEGAASFTVTGTVTVKDSGGSTTVGDSIVATRASASDPIKLHSYKGAELNADQVKAAITKLLKATNVTLSDDLAGGIADGKAFTIAGDSTSAGSGSAKKPVEMVKVTIGSKTLYLDRLADGYIEGLDANAFYILKGTTATTASTDKSADGDANGVAIDAGFATDAKGKSTAAVDLLSDKAAGATGVIWDIEYVPAVKVTATGDGGAPETTPGMGYVVTSGLTSTPTAVDAGDIVAKGTQVYLTAAKTTFANGDVVLVKAGSTIVPLKATGAVTSISGTTTAAVESYANAQNVVALTVESGAISVYVNGVQRTTGGTNGAYFVEGDRVGGLDDTKSYIVSSKKTAAALTATTNDELRITSAVVAAAANDGNALYIWEAYAYTAQTDADLAASDPVKVVAPDGTTENPALAYIAKDAKVTVTAKQGYTVLKAKDITLTSENASDWKGDGAGKWSFTMTKAITEEDYISLSYKITSAANAFATSLTKDNMNNGGDEVTGLKIAGTGADLKTIGASATLTLGGDLAEKLEVSSKDNQASGIEFSLKAKENATVGNNETGTLTLKIGVLEIAFNLSSGDGRS